MPIGKLLARWKDSLSQRLSFRSASSALLSVATSTEPNHSPPLQDTTKIPAFSATAQSATNILSATAPLSTAGQSKSSSAVSLPRETLGVQPLAFTLPPTSAASAPASSNSPVTQSCKRRAAWVGLKTLLKVLESSADAFGPLKSAVGGLNQCIDIYERCAKGREDYDELQMILNSLLEDLCESFGGPVSPTMTTSMNNICNGILKELDKVKEKRERGAIQRYAKAMGDSDDVLECYKRIHGHLRRLTLNANLNIWKTVEGLATEIRLEKLSGTGSGVYNSAKAATVKRGPCTQGTREEVLIKLQGWARDRNAGGVCWMNGMAGTGKTTITYSLCDSLSKSSELGASFFCSRQLPECRNVDAILPSIAYQLARFSRPFCHALLQVLEVDPDAHTRELKVQLENLIVKPLFEVKDTLPSNVIVVIDALDECESKNSVGQILDVLLARVSESNLPIRFLIASRPELEIYERMIGPTGATADARLVLHELDKTRVKRDIGTYLRHELMRTSLSNARLAALVEQSGVLFVFASTAARYINDGILMDECEERLDSILGLSPPSADSERGIDVLYSTILAAAFGNAKFTASNRSQMKSILDTIVCAQEPLTVDTLAGLLKLKSSKQVDGLLRPLYSVLNVSITTKLVSTLHASFPDFMLERQRSASFYCDSLIKHGQLARACFEVIKTNNPQFNICRLESSYVRDDDVADFSDRVDKAVSPGLFYSCQYWMTHLELGEIRADVTELLYDFLSVRLLLWIEVLNVKKVVYLGPKIIQSAERWSMDHGRKDQMIELARDAWRFVTLFASHAVSQSTPHIYTSMLPFWSNSGPIAKCYIKRMQRMIEPRGAALTRRTSALLTTWTFGGLIKSVCFSPDGSKVAFCGDSVHVVHGTTGQLILGPLGRGNVVFSVAFSSNGTRIVSGSSDKTIQVWDLQSGKAILGPLKGHNDNVYSVCFAPDGMCIVSGSGDSTIRLWDAYSGGTVLGPLHGHNGRVYSVCFSPDGTRVASGSSDKTIRLWDVRTGETNLGPLQGHTSDVHSVCFSPDGMYIVSGSYDRTIRVWDVQSGGIILGPLEGHTNGISSVCFSPDSTRIASGSYNKTIRVWDLQTGETILGPFEGHTDSVNSVCFSPDGTHIVSGSQDKTVRLWDARGGGTILGLPEGHLDSAASVCFSPDCKRIVSGSYDRTIRAWDVHNGEVTLGPLHGHTSVVRSVCFSPDGTHIVSGSYDKTIRVWEVQSGEKVIGPLEGHTDRIISVCFSPDGTRIVSGAYDQTIRVWDVQSGKTVLGPLRGHSRPVAAVFFSPDGTRIVSGSYDHTIRVWDARNGGTILGPLQGHISTVTSVCFSPDGTRIASGSHDRTIRIWDAQSGKVILNPLEGHSKGITSVCFSPDGTRIASGSDDMTIRLWSVRSGGTSFSPLKGHTSTITSLCFSSDGARIVSGSLDKTIRVWDVDAYTESLMSIVANECSSPYLFDPWSLDEDSGWVVDSKSRILAWVPHDLWTALLRPQNTLLISRQGSFRLNFDPAKLGESWAECYNAPQD